MRISRRFQHSWPLAAGPVLGGASPKLPLNQTLMQEISRSLTTTRKLGRVAFDQLSLFVLHLVRLIRQIVAAKDG